MRGSFEIAEIVRNYAVAVAALVGASTALFGLVSWKKERRWEDDRELSRKTLLSLLKYRDAILSASLPYENSKSVCKIDFEHDLDEKNEQTPIEVVKALAATFDASVEARSSLQVFLQEAVAVWGVNLNPLLEKLFELHAELEEEVQMYAIADDQRRSKEDRIDAQKYLRGSRGILFSETDRPKVDFETELNNAITPAIKFLRSKLER